MLTEKEAATKWCPEVRRADGGDNCDADGNRRTPYCIGSSCMMWRKIDQIGIGPNGEKRDRDMDGRTRWVDRGYCGLAGRP
jgi:hypothetical protein